jgi:hypothetical protein
LAESHACDGQPPRYSKGRTLIIAIDQVGSGDADCDAGRVVAARSPSQMTRAEIVGSTAQPGRRLRSGDVRRQRAMKFGCGGTGRRPRPAASFRPSQPLASSSRGCTMPMGYAPAASVEDPHRVPRACPSRSPRPGRPSRGHPRGPSPSLPRHCAGRLFRRGDRFVAGQRHQLATRSAARLNHLRQPAFSRKPRQGSPSAVP